MSHGILVPSPVPPLDFTSLNLRKSSGSGGSLINSHCLGTNGKQLPSHLSNGMEKAVIEPLGVPVQCVLGGVGGCLSAIYGNCTDILSLVT